MNPLEALESAIFYGCCPGGRYPHDGIKHYLRNGKEIPEFLLPGGVIKRSDPKNRDALSRLTSRQVADVADWHIRKIVG